MIEKLKEEMSQSTGNQIFKETEDSIVEKDINNIAFSIGKDAVSIVAHSELTNTYELEPFTIIGTGKDLTEALSHLLDIEAKLCFKLLLKTVMSNAGDERPKNKIVIIREDDFKSSLEKIQYEVEKHRLLSDKFIINRSELGLFKKNLNAIDYDPPGDKDSLMTGNFGSIWGINIFVDSKVNEVGVASDSVPDGMIFTTTEGRYLGRKKIFDIDLFETDEKCIIICKMGMTVCNPRAVAVGSLLKNLNISLKDNIIND